MIRDHAVDIPTEVLLILKGIRFHNDPDGEYIIDLVKGDVLCLHLIPDGIDRLHAAFQFIGDLGLIHVRDDGLGELIDETGTA